MTMSLASLIPGHSDILGEHGLVLPTVPTKDVAVQCSLLLPPVSGGLPPSRYWRFTIFDPNARPFIQGRIRQIAYDVLDDRVCGVVCYKTTVRRCLPMYSDMSMERLTAVEYHEQCASMSHVMSSPSMPMDKKGAGRHASASRSFYIHEAKEGRLQSIPEGLREKYTRTYRMGRRRVSDEASRANDEGGEHTTTNNACDHAVINVYNTPVTIHNACT